MKKIGLILLVVGFLLAGPVCPPGRAASWSGVDETVIEKFAEKAGRTAREPFINTDQGDLLLFVFLLAGIVGGFIGGYYLPNPLSATAAPRKKTGGVSRFDRIAVAGERRPKESAPFRRNNMNRGKAVTESHDV